MTGYENTQKTKKDYFFEVFPNAPKGPWGCPVLCVRNVGLKDDVIRCEPSCMDCWNETYKGE